MTVHQTFTRTVVAGAVFATIGLGSTMASAQDTDTVRVALGDVVSVETLGFLEALEHAKARGLDYELTSFAEEDLAIQATIGGQVDVGIGTPYSIIQKTKVPIRNIFQVSTLVFFPVVANKYETWKDLDGEPFTFHARGTATEAYGDVIAKKEGIEFGQRSYVPGSENRVVAMMNGTIDATIVDLSNKNLLLKEAPDKFHVLPGVDAKVSDEILFANQNWIEEHPKAVKILTEELLKQWRAINDDPTIVEKQRKELGLLTDQPQEVLDEVDAYYKEGVEAGLWNTEGASEKLAKDDFDFYVAAGQMDGPADSLKVADFWDLKPVEDAKAALGE